MIDFGTPGRAAGVLLLALAAGLTAVVTAGAKDIPGRKRCFVAGIETYKEEPVYRDKSSGYQRVQVPGSKGERCFWEPLNYQAAAAAAPVRPSRAAPAISGRRAQAESTAARSRSAAAPQTAAAPASKKTPQRQEPRRLAALPPQPQSGPRPQSRPEPQSRSEPAPRPQPETTPQSRPEPQPRSEPAPRPQPEPMPQSRPEQQPRSEPAPQPQPDPTPAPQTRAEPEPQSRAQRAPQPRPEPEPEPQTEPEPQRAPEPRHSVPALSPRGLNSNDSTSSQDLRIETRPVTSGGTLSTASSGPEIQSLVEEDRVVPPAGKPMQVAAAREAMASLSPRTAVRSSRPRADEPANPPPAERESGPASSSESASRAGARPASQGEGGTFVQLGSVTSYQKAKQFWTDVTGRYPEALAGFSPNIVEADIPGKGIWYRVRVGPLASGKAKALCKRLEGNCLVVSQ